MKKTSDVLRRDLTVAKTEQTNLEKFVCSGSSSPGDPFTE
eukprot:gene9149-2980_t